MQNRDISWEVVVTGRVQGVSFRAYTQEKAIEFGVRGWVRNEWDGSVTAVIQHEDEQVLEQVVAELRIGPPASEVVSVNCSVAVAEPHHQGFSIRR